MPDGMSEQSERLKIARKRKGYDCPIEAARAFGWNENTYWSNENGNARFSFNLAQRYAERYNVRAEWLYSGDGPMVEASIPLLSWVSAGNLRSLEIETQESGEVFTLLKGLPRSKYFATIVEGSSMNRISPDGSVIIVDMNDIKPISGRSYIFSIQGEATYKIYRDRPVIHLEPFSTDPSHETIFPTRGEGPVVVVGRVVRSCFDPR